MENISSKPESSGREVPLFIKLDKYSTIIDLLNSIKTTATNLKACIEILKNLEKVRNESIQVMEGILAKLEKGIDNISSEMRQPVEEIAEVKEEIKDIESLLKGITEIKEQIEQIKVENL